MRACVLVCSGPARPKTSVVRQVHLSSVPAELQGLATCLAWKTGARGTEQRRPAGRTDGEPVQVSGVSTGQFLTAFFGMESEISWKFHIRA